MFIILGIREFPRSTLVYLYLFNYWDTFLPFFYTCVSHDQVYTTKELFHLVMPILLKSLLHHFIVVCFFFNSNMLFMFRKIILQFLNGWNLFLGLSLRLMGLLANLHFNLSINITGQLYLH